MPKVLMDYIDPIPTQIVGNEIDELSIINSRLGTVAGKYYNRTKRLDTDEERVELERPVAFTVILTPERMGMILGIISQAAGEQGVLRPANARLDTSDIVVIPPPPVPVTATILPANPQLAPGATQQFEAVVANVPEGGTVAVHWFLRTGDSGSIDENGLYTAPTVPGTYRVLARSEQDTTVVGYTDITVV